MSANPFDHFYDYNCNIIDTFIGKSTIEVYHIIYSSLCHPLCTDIKKEAPNKL